ncbi:probable WRKY transcription factor 14 [Cornus florida]|uniref:probable WRKY transcription factor 14 n=1 Tax=Cornus florida TaxID=4283 RepID=UPI0028A0A30F|nr:probable WRKY transcription factor 14 [Cornus florida]
MCSYLLQRMENYQGDLTDMLRASGGSGGGGTAGEQPPVGSDWQFPSHPMNYPSEIEEPVDDFGDPFSNIRDPLLHELNIPNSNFFDSSNNSLDMTKTSHVEALGGGGGGFNSGGVFSHQQIIDRDDQIKRPCNVFSRMLQISPVSPCDSPVVAAAASPRETKVPALVANDHMISGNSSKSCLIEHTGIQISSPQHTGIKRRKSQAKKVVCIPAPAPANSRSTGEVVPSDLWAWRKYGQKPIKGSPYPRGYYRCSSSKGCSARKQVERSRTDPNMLVITYTSEHNHPWPTQRNALAGSTRSQPSKSNAASKNLPASQTQKTTRSLKEEEKESNYTTHENNVSSSTNITANSTNTGSSVKEEMEDLDKQIEMDDDEFSTEGFIQSYRPALPDYSSNQCEDFFADLGEIEADPLNLLFTQAFTADEERENNKALDPFSLFDWTASNNNNTSIDHQEAKRGL